MGWEKINVKAFMLDEERILVNIGGHSLTAVDLSLAEELVEDN